MSDRAKRQRAGETVRTKVCAIVRNGKGRKQNDQKATKKKSRASSLVGRDTWMAKRAPCALSTLKHPEGESMQHRSAIFPRQHGSASLAGWMSTSQTRTVIWCGGPSLLISFYLSFGRVPGSVVFKHPPALKVGLLTRHQLPNDQSRGNPCTL